MTIEVRPVIKAPDTLSVAYSGMTFSKYKKKLPRDKSVPLPRRHFRHHDNGIQQFFRQYTFTSIRSVGCFLILYSL